MRILAVTVEKAFLDALLHPLEEIFHFDQLNDALDLLARHEPQPHLRDDAEESVAADGQAKQFGVLVPAAGAKITLRIDQDEGLDITDDRLEAKTAAVGVCGEGPADS